MYFCMCMFCLLSGMFGAAAIEKKIEKSYTRLAELETAADSSRKEDRKALFIIENVFCFNVKKLHNITFKA